MSKSEKPSIDKSKSDPLLEELEIGGAIYTTRLTSKFKNRVTWVRPDKRNVKAVIPGAIRNIMITEGSKVSQGTPLMILEAMKMENLVLSPIEGVIKKIHVTVGDQVSKSQLLLEFI